MYKVKVSSIKKGEFFRFKENEDSPLWVRDEYNRSTRRYIVYKYDNVNQFRELKGSHLVYADIYD